MRVRKPYSLLYKSLRPISLIRGSNITGNGPITLLQKKLVNKGKSKEKI